MVAPTRWMLRALERHYGTLPRACVITDGRSASRFHPGEKEPMILGTGRLLLQSGLPVGGVGGAALAPPS